MATVAMLRDQLAELRMMIDHNDPVHVETEAAFAAIVAKIVHQTEIGPRGGFSGAMPKRLMLGTAEAYDALAGHERETEIDR